MNIVQEYPLTHSTRTAQNEISKCTEVYKYIVDEVYHRANNGDDTSIAILKSALSKREVFA